MTPLRETEMLQAKPARTVHLDDHLKAWSTARKRKPFSPSNWRNDFDKIKKAIGYRTRDEDTKDRPVWPEDVIRHTAISHYFRKVQSYGAAAERFGNSEAIIKAHYQGRVSSTETAAFYAIMPMTSTPP